MPLFQTLTLAIVQGITEFLPVSSSAHLLLMPVFTNWEDQGLAFDVALHAGSLAAVIIYFRNDISGMGRALWRSIATKTLTDKGRLAWAIIIGTIPVGIAGFLLRDFVAGFFRSPTITAAGLIGFGLLLGFADWRKRGGRTIADLRWRDVMFIGCAQALALIPGTSRSGITITAGLFFGFTREAAARFSFLLSIPVIALAGLYEMNTLIGMGPAVDWSAVFIGMLVSGITAYTCIHFFLTFIGRVGMQPFVVYRVILGVVLLVVGG